MAHQAKATIFAALLVTVGAPAIADEIVRDAALIETIAIEGVSLDMSPQQALEHLLANGYSAGEITTFAEWEGPNVSLVRGSYASPVGESWVSLDRRGALLVQISQTFNRTRGDLFDPSAEIGAVQSHFGIAADHPDCHVNDRRVTGACSVQDAEETPDADLAFVITVGVNMIIRVAARTQQLGSP